MLVLKGGSGTQYIHKNSSNVEALKQLYGHMVVLSNCYDEEADVCAATTQQTNDQFPF